MSKIIITEEQALRLGLVKEGSELKLDANQVFQIYDILTNKVDGIAPEIARKHSKSSFYHLLNSKIV